MDPDNLNTVNFKPIDITRGRHMLTWIWLIDSRPVLSTLDSPMYSSYSGVAKAGPEELQGVLAFVFTVQLIDQLK